MGITDKIRAKPQIVKINDVEFELHKIKTSQLLTMAGMQQKGETTEALKYILTETLKKSRIKDGEEWKTLSDDDIENLDPAFTLELVQKIGEVNGLRADDIPLSMQSQKTQDKI